MASNFDKLFNPDGIAIIGASRDPGKVGSVILKNLRITYHGNIFPVNLASDEIQGLKTYSKVTLIKENVDVAIISIPAEKVLQVLKDCEKKKVSFAIIISAGFGESGHSGVLLENAIKKFLNTAKIRVIGPNCLGVINTEPYYNTTFIDPNSKPFPGKTAFISQSGALLSAIVDDATLDKIGFSKIISVGNSIDMDEAKFLEVLKDDENTKAITLYLEGLRDGKSFLKSALETSKKKPIIVLKGGKSKGGAEAASSHTGALAGSDIAYELAFKKSGIISVGNIDDLFNFMRDAPGLRIKSDEVIIVTNAGGAGVIATDAVYAAGLKLAKLSANTTNELSKILPREANIHNPIDILGDATPERYKEVLEAVYSLNKPIIVIFSPQEMSLPIETAKEISEIHLQNKDLPLLPVFLGGARIAKAKRLLREINLPVYSYPHEAVDIIKGMYSYSAFSQPVYSTYNKTNVKKTKLNLKTNLFGLDAKTIFDKLAIKTAMGVKVKTEEDALKAAVKTGYPCVLKVGSNEIVHKHRIGGVIVGIKNEDELKKAFESMKAKMTDDHIKYTHFEVYKDVTPKKGGIEILLGGHLDPQFGPMIAIGIGGDYANIIEEVTFLLAPISDEDLTNLRNSKIGRLLASATKRKIVDEIISYTIKLAKLMEENPMIKDIDLNPLVVSEDDAIATDFKVYTA
ncbi:MAG: acetate--CoA ligase family protein [Candidatus Parvarchaeota archaeon]|nr:acetate--CoA ligase family protein [Candidatus Parvarchaeota archaeon]